MPNLIKSDQFSNTRHDEVQLLELDKNKVAFFTTPYAEVNQDSIGYFHDPESQTTILLLADGMGGHSEGEKASKSVIQGIINELKNVVEMLNNQVKVLEEKSKSGE